MDDLFFRLSENIRRDVFHFTEESEQELREKINELLNPDESKCEDIDCDKYAAISKFGLEQIPLQYVLYKNIQNPYFRWSRVRGRHLFQWGNTRSKYPNGMINMRYSHPDTAYITNGFEAKGAYGTVKTLVAYCRHISVIKSMADDESDFFELVTQAFLHEFCAARYAKIKVPEIFFTQHNAKNSKIVDVCMSRGVGTFLSDMNGIYLKIAFVHVLKALWFLQRDVYFMHRDLGSHNVMFDRETHTVTFIDFGMSCLNPPTADVPPKDVSWSARDYTFFLLAPNSHAKKCTNRSLDACILLETIYQADKDPFFVQEHGSMRKKMEDILRSTDKIDSKRVFYNKRHGQFTHITKYRGRDIRHRNLDVFYMGNDNNQDDINPHWWVYNCVEFPLEGWFPENIIGRLLQHLPFEHWFALRRNWATTFDSIAPTDLKVNVKKGATVHLPDKTEITLQTQMSGFFQKCVRHKLRIRLVNFAVITVSPEYVDR